jgi:hypothetical protein
MSLNAGKYLFNFILVIKDLIETKEISSDYSISNLSIISNSRPKIRATHGKTAAQVQGPLEGVLAASQLVQCQTTPCRLGFRGLGFGPLEGVLAASQLVQCQTTPCRSGFGVQG